MGIWQRETEKREKGGTRARGRRQKTLDGRDGKFRDCGPIFNSGCQATSKQQGSKGWPAKRDHTG